jgi:hypothetical protein
MDERMNDLDRLAVLDPARDREPSALEWTRSEAFIERTMAGQAPRTGQPPMSRRLIAGAEPGTGRPLMRRWLFGGAEPGTGRPLMRRWLIAGAGAMAVGAVAAVAIPALVPGAAEQGIASWTAMPTARTGDQVMPQARACAGNDVIARTTASASDVLLAEQRGESTLLIMRKGGHLVECLLVGNDEAAASMALIEESAIVVPPAGTVELETSSSLGEGDGEWSNALGLAAPDVTAVEVRLKGGGTVHASVKSGWWAAWWPGSEGGNTDDFTVTVHAGTRTTTHKASDLP